MVNDSIRISLFSHGILFVYYQVIEWVNLFPWNDISGGNGQASLDLIVAALLAVLILATWRRFRWVMVIGVGLYALWTWLQIDSWWMPYFRGASPNWENIYARFFGETIKWLPSDSSHLSPDASHIVLQMLILAALVSTALSVFQLFSKSRCPALGQ